MTTMFMLLFILGFVNLAMTLSVVESKKWRFLYTVILACLPLIVMKVVSTMRYDFVTTFLESRSAMESYCLIRLLEIFPVLYALVNYLSPERKVKRFHQLFAFYPDSGAILGILFFQLLLFYKINGLSYVQISLSYSLVIILSILLGIPLIMRFFNERELRFEMRILLLLLQGAIATYLPMFTGNVKMSNYSDPISMEGLSLFILLLLIGFAVGSGVTLVKRFIRKKQNGSN